MSLFRSLEQRIGGLVEGVFGRTFRSGVQPVELARKLAKEMDDHRTISVHRVYVPNEYTVYLNPHDREQFSGYEEQMRLELGEYLVEHARREGYSVATRPMVVIETESDLSVGMFGIAVATRERDPDEPPAAPAAPPAPAPAVPEGPVPAATMVYAPARTETSEEAVLSWSGGSFKLESASTVIGRSSECAVCLNDANVSRRHAEIRRIGEAYSLIDLGSTNGTEVNGQRITETSLMNGDVIGIGTTRITFERRLG
jgi:hypothetical protein